MIINATQDFPTLFGEWAPYKKMKGCFFFTVTQLTIVRQHNITRSQPFMCRKGGGTKLPKESSDFRGEFKFPKRGPEWYLEMVMVPDQSFITATHSVNSFIVLRPNKFVIDFSVWQWDITNQVAISLSEQGINEGHVPRWDQVID